MENKISEMKRHEVIYELAKYCHPSQYHRVIEWKTEYLKTLLEWYIENPQTGKEVQFIPSTKAITIIISRIQQREKRTQDQNAIMRFKMGI